MGSKAYIGAATSTANVQNYTFSSQAIGSAAADRYVLVLVEASGGVQTIDTLTIAGNSATRIMQSASADPCVAAFIRLVTSGTTADIVVGLSGTLPRCGIHVYNIFGLSSATPHEALAATAASASSRTVNLDIPANGVAFACAIQKANNTCTWTGLTEDADATTNSNRFTAASDDLSEESNRTITATFSGSQNVVMGAVSFAYIPPAQTVTQSSRHDDSDTLYAGTVSASNTVQAPFVPSPEDFFAGSVVPGAVTVQAPFLDNATDDFYAATVQKYNDVEAPFLDGSANTFYGGVIVQGTTVVAPYLDDSADTFYEGEVLLGGVTIHAPFIANVDTFYTHLIQHIVRPALFSNANTFYGGQVNMTAYAPFLNDGETFYAGTIQRVAYAPFFDDSADTFYGPTINRTVYAPFLASAAVFYGGLVGFGQTLTASLFVDGDTFYGGTVTVTGFNRMWHKDAEDGWQQHDWSYRMYSEWRDIDAGWYKTADGWQQFYAKSK